MKITRLTGGLLVFIAATVFSINAMAAAVIDPDTGGDYYFWWQDGLGENVEGIYEYDWDTGQVDWSTDYGTEWEITVAEESYLDFVAVWDFAEIGDEFMLIVDGEPVEWTYYEESDDTSGTYFYGEYEDLLLSAGTHTITLEITGISPDSDPYGSGGGFISFGGTYPVPEPASLILLGTGIAGLAGFRTRKKRT